MKIALLGYGRMGKEIEKIALKKGHQVLVKDSATTEIDWDSADVAIDFSIPDAAVGNIRSCFEKGIPVVSGTTGWLDQYDEMVTLCKQENGSFLYSSNFSLGVNLFFELNRHLAKLMAPYSQYTPEIEEIHHTKKLDAPSGTAISLAEDIIDTSSKKDWQLSDAPDEDHIGITAKRIPDVPGTHTITYQSDIDQISINHTAHNRSGFAMGALMAAEWLVHHKGVYSMKDVLNIS